MKSGKKVISSFLAFAITVGAVPSAIFADDIGFGSSAVPAEQLETVSNYKGAKIEYSLDLPSKKEIQKKYFELNMDDTPSTVYSEAYSLTVPYSAGALSDTTLQQALDTVNFIRFTAGVNPVVLNDTYNNLTQHASLVNAVNNQLTHSPSQPAGMSDEMYELGKTGAGSSNLGRGHSSIPHSLISYMEDTDSSNIDRVGHRRWLINPPMQEIGFGKVGAFTATYAFDNWSGGILVDDFIAWPPQNMPYELYQPSSMGYAFSVNLGYDYDIPSIENVTVKMYSKLQNKTWNLDKTSTDKYSNYLNVENSNYGMSKCIIFNVGKFANNDTVTVTINGIYKDGVHSPITYDVDFFSVYDEIKLDTPTGLKAVSDNGSAVLTWNSVDDATSYSIYRAERTLGVKTKLGTATGTSYTDTTAELGKTYYYFVKAHNSADEIESNYSEATSVVVTDESNISDFVERLYTKLLGRTSDANGKAKWVEKLKNGATAADVAVSFVLSTELEQQNLSNETFVKRMYQTMLNRTPADSEIANWASYLDAGCTYAFVFRGFLTAPEFANLCSSYGIKTGTYAATENRDVNGKLTKFISRLYTKALGRTYDISGLNYHTGNYISGKYTLDKIAYGFIFSAEFEKRNLSDEKFVECMYNTFFNRASDANGKASWLQKMANGKTREDVFNGFVNSPEYKALVKSFGL